VTAGIDIVTNDAGDRVRRAHARDMGEDVIVALHRLVRLTRLHDSDNEAFSRQLEQTHKLVVEYCLHAGTHLTVLFASKVVLIGGQILKGSRSAYDAALDLGEILSWCGGAELAIARDITMKELKAFSDALSEAQRGRRTDSFESPTRKIRLRAVSASARLRGVDIEPMSVEQKVVRTYASAVVVMRRFFDDLRRGQYVLPPKIKRIAQSLVDLSEGKTPAFLGVTEVRNQNHDDAGRAVNTAILSVAAARQITPNRALLCQVAMAALMHDVARPRALGQFTGGLPGVVPKLSEDAEDRQPAGAAAVLTALGRVNEPTVARTVVTYESLWLRRSTYLGPLYGGLREPTVHARIIAIARRYNDLVTPEPGLPPPAPDVAIARIFGESEHPADKTVLRMLVAALGLFPVGTLVRLSTGETAEVVAGRDMGAPTDRPRVQIIMDARGGMVTPPREVDLARPPPDLRNSFIQSVLSTDGWGRGVDLEAEAQEQEEQRYEPVSSAPPPPPASAPPRSFAPAAVPADEAFLLEVSESPGSYPPSEPSYEDSGQSALSNSASRSLGWHDAPAPVTRGPARDDPLRQTVPASLKARQAMPTAPPPTVRAGPQPPPEPQDEDERTVYEVSPYGDQQHAAVPEDEADDDEAGTIFFQRGSAPPVVTGAQLREQAGIPPTAQGDLAKTPLVHVLVYVLDRELSGSMVVLDPEGREHCVFFDRGAPAKVRTEHPVAMLGEELIAARMLPPAALDAMVRAAQEHTSLLGDYLVRNRLVTRVAVDQALRSQVIHRLEWLAKLPGETRYEFYRDQNLLASWGGEMTPCEPLGAILCAMRSWNDHDRIISNLMRLKDNPIRLHPKASLEGILLTPEEDRVVSIIRTREVSLLELYGNSLAADRGISAFLYMLFATRQLQIPGQDRAPMRSSLQGRPAVPLPDSQRAPLLAHVDPTVTNAPDQDDDELSYESYPSLATSPSAVAQAVITDMKAAISFRPDAPPEAAPSTESIVPMGLEPTARGKLGGTPLIHVLTYMLDHQATGTVVFQEPDGVQHVAYFENGAAAKVRTGRPIAQLGELLVAAGQLSPDQLDLAVSTAQEIGALLGEYLIVDNLSSRGAVIHALESQVTAKIVGLANLSDDARYAYYRGTNLLATWAGDDLFPANALSLILAVARAWQDRRRIRGALHKIVDQELRLHAECDLARLATTDGEVAVLNAIVAGGLTLRDLHGQRLARQDDVNSLVYALAITRQFQFRKQQKPPMRFVGARRSQLDPPVSARPSRPPPSDPPSASGMRVSFVPAQTFGAGPASQQAAPSSERSPVSLPYPAAAALRREPTSEQSPPPQSYGAVPSSQQPVSQRYQQAQVANPLPVPRPPPLRASRPSWPGLDAQDPAPASAPPAPASTPPSAVRRTPAVPASPPASDEEKDRAAQDFRAAQEALKRGDLARAERLARQALENDPEAEDHAALLAWIRASSPRPNALGESIAALTNLLRRHPRCELALLYRSKLFRRANKVDPALSDLDQLLAINPDHREAQAEARLLRAKQRSR
jgi:hypothetical protein